MRVLAIWGCFVLLGGCVEVPDRDFDRQRSGDGAAPADDGAAPGADARPDAASPRDGGEVRDARPSPDGRPTDGAPPPPADGSAPTDGGGPHDGAPIPDAGPPPPPPPPGPCREVVRAGDGPEADVLAEAVWIYRDARPWARLTLYTDVRALERIATDVEGRRVRTEFYSDYVGGRLFAPDEVETVRHVPGKSIAERSGPARTDPLRSITEYAPDGAPLRLEVFVSNVVAERWTIEHQPAAQIWRRYLVVNGQPTFNTLAGPDAPAPERVRTVELLGPQQASRVVDRVSGTVREVRTFDYSCWTCDDGGCTTEPPEEACDGADDDLDGLVDEGVSNACGGCGAPPAEVFDGQDQDCDGAIDEGVEQACGGESVVCSNDIGRCEPGAMVCRVETGWSACNGTLPGVEACDGQDDDCDGRIDEGALTACNTCTPPALEACNGLDDDCDGVVDEVAVCACPPAEGLVACWGRRPSCVYAVEDVAPLTTCDAVCEELGGTCVGARAAQATCVEPNRMNCAEEASTLTCECTL